MICLLNNNLRSTIFRQFSQEAKLLGACSQTILPQCSPGETWRIVQDIFVWKQLVSFMNRWSLALKLWVIHMFVQRLMKVVGIATSRLRLMVWKVVCKVFVIIGFTVIKNSLNYLKGLSVQRRYWRLWGIHNNWQYPTRDSMFEGWHWCRIPEMVPRSIAAGLIYRYCTGNTKGYKGSV